MDTNNWRPTAPAGEPTMDTCDWRAQLTPDARQRVVNKILAILKKHLPFSGQEGLQELEKIAVRFEEKIYTAARNQPDYLGKVFLKTLTMDIKSQNNITAPAGEPTMDTGDWRAQLPPDLRQGIVNEILETLKKHIPFSGQGGLQELKKIAVRLEENIYTAATNRPDYLRKLSLKMLTMETESQNILTGMTSINWRPTAPAGEPTMDTGDWRAQLPPNLGIIVNEIFETLKKHLPFSGQEGLQELKKIAVRFEEKIYTAATN